MLWHYPHIDATFFLRCHRTSGNGCLSGLYKREILWHNRCLPDDTASYNIKVEVTSIVSLVLNQVWYYQ